MPSFLDRREGEGIIQFGLEYLQNHDLMEKPRKIPYKSFGKKVDERFDRIIYKVMTNEGLEETISKAVVKALIALVKRYLFLAIIGVLLLLVIQSILLSMVIKMTM